MKSKLFVLAFALVSLCCCGREAFADNAEKRQCLKDVQSEYSTCNKVCVDTKKENKISCGLNPECHKSCSADLDSCLDPYQNQTIECRKTCSTSYDAAKLACKESSQCTGNCWTNAAFLSCIRPAGVARFNCDQDCKDSERLDTTTQAAIKGCREAAKTCHKACKVPVTPAP